MSIINIVFINGTALTGISYLMFLMLIILTNIFLGDWHMESFFFLNFEVTVSLDMSLLRVNLLCLFLYHSYWWFLFSDGWCISFNTFKGMRLQLYPFLNWCIPKWITKVLTPHVTKQLNVISMVWLQWITILKRQNDSYDKVRVTTEQLWPKKYSDKNTFHSEKSQ